MYMTVKQAAEKWGISDRRVPVRIMGAKHEPVQPYLIQPIDGAVAGNLQKQHRAYDSATCTILY